MDWVVQKEEDQLGTIGFGVLMMLSIIPCYLGDQHTHKLNPQKDPNWGMTMLGGFFLLVGLIFTLYKLRAVLAQRTWKRIELAASPAKPGQPASVHIRVTPRKTVKIDRIQARLFGTFLERAVDASEYSDGGTALEELLILSEATTLEAGTEYIFNASTLLPADARLSDQSTEDVSSQSFWRYEVTIAVHGGLYWNGAQGFDVT